jgi:hypothetical protein
MGTCPAISALSTLSVHVFKELIKELTGTVVLPLNSVRIWKSLKGLNLSHRNTFRRLKAILEAFLTADQNGFKRIEAREEEIPLLQIRLNPSKSAVNLHTFSWDWRELRRRPRRLIHFASLQA